MPIRAEADRNVVNFKYCIVSILVLKFEEALTFWNSDLIMEVEVYRIYSQRIISCRKCHGNPSSSFSLDRHIDWHYHTIGKNHSWFQKEERKQERFALAYSFQPQTTAGWVSQQAGYLCFSLSLCILPRPEPNPSSFPKAPLCHELSLNATLLSIDLLAVHFLSRFDVTVVSVYGRFPIKLWRGFIF